MALAHLSQRLISAPLRFGQRALFPPSCLLCRAVTDAPGKVCPSCWAQITFLDGSGCQYCARPTVTAFAHQGPETCDQCLRHPPLWDRGAAVFLYQGAGRRMVLGLKHGDRQDMVGLLGSWAATAGQELFAEADAIIPIPLHWTRRLKRRGNHAAWLARAIARKIGKPRAFQPSAILRTRKTTSQDGKNRQDRVANLLGAFSAARGYDLTGQRVVLIDDVLTTGATLNAATLVCREMGAAQVDICVLALVPRDEGGYMASEDKDPYHDKS